MDKEILKKYIQFAIDNGYEDKIEEWKIVKPKNSHIKGKIVYANLYVSYIGQISGCTMRMSVTDFIMEKEFIEAVVRGIIRESNSKTHNFFERGDLKCFDFSKSIDEVTNEQAIAIRDGKLKKFIISVLDGKIVKK